MQYLEPVHFSVLPSLIKATTTGTLGRELTGDGSQDFIPLRDASICAKDTRHSWITCSHNVTVQTGLDSPQKAVLDKSLLHWEAADTVMTMAGVCWLPLRSV